MKKTRSILFTCFIILIFFIGIYIYKINIVLNSHSGATTTASVKFVSSTITADGMVTAQNQETLSFQTIGKLIYLPFKEGDTVLQGQVVAQLDGAKLQANLRQAEQSFTAAKAASEKLYNDQGSSTSESFDQKVKRTAVDATQNIAYDAVVKARQDIADATLLASINGIVLHEGVTMSGTNISPATTFIIADPETMVFRANVPTEQIYYIAQGSTVTLSIDGIDKKMQGTVVHISPSKVILPTGQAVYQVDIASDELKTSAKLDENGQAIIRTNAKNVALVPAWTVIGGKYIWIDNNGTPKLVQVTVGKIHENQIEILEGLSADDTIILDPKFIPSHMYQIL